MKRILIIEDEESIAELEKDYLELSGFEVEIENDGAEGLKKALSEEFDLFILDLMLPGVDGFEICRKVREVKNTPIIMVSAKKEDIDKIRGLGLGADDYITKPFSPSEMVARVKAHLARYERLIGSSMPDNEIIGGYMDLYLLAEREGTTLEQSREVKFIEDQTAFKATARYDGKPVRGEAFVVVRYDNVAPVTSATFAADSAN